MGSRINYAFRKAAAAALNRITFSGIKRAYRSERARGQLFAAVAGAVYSNAPWVFLIYTPLSANDSGTVYFVVSRNI